MGHHAAYHAHPACTDECKDPVSRGTNSGGRHMFTVGEHDVWGSHAKNTDISQAANHRRLQGVALQHTQQHKQMLGA